MARKVKKIYSAGSYDTITHTPLDYYTQTPGNYDIDNYYLRELQDKVDAEWALRPNRVITEYEVEKASNTWAPIEVVSQSVKNEKGKDISEDYLNLVFRDIQESRFEVGHKFRFSRSHDINARVQDKNVWLVMNRNMASMTSSVTIQRCNGSLCSRWIDEQGVAHNHYEPVILAGDLNSVNFFYNQVADSPQAHLVVIAQYNKYTAQYQMNQRFILGARHLNADGRSVSQVYRIKTMDDFYSKTTYDSDNIGIMKIYMEITEISPYDNFDTRVAYQENSNVYLHTDTQEGSLSVDLKYSFIFLKPKHISKTLGSAKMKFIPMIVDSNGNKHPELMKYVKTSWQLQNCPDKEGLPEKYIGFTEKEDVDENEQYNFTLQRKRIYLNGDLKVICELPAEHSPTQESIITSFTLVVREQEA